MLQRCSIIVGSHSISLSLKPGIESEGESFNSLRSTQASSTGYRDQMFGPRSVRIFRNSMASTSGGIGGRGLTLRLGRRMMYSTGGRSNCTREIARRPEESMGSEEFYFLGI